MDTMTTLKFSLPVLAGGLLLLSWGCGESAKTATATLESKSASTVTGTATFTQDGSKVSLKLEAAGLTPGTHAVHLHEVGDCSAADAMSAGTHWNPSQAMHGNSATGAHHAGDVGNLTAAADGKASLSFTTSEWTIGDGVSATDVVGHAVIVHASADDFVTPNTGNAGARQACGVIKLQ